MRDPERSFPTWFFDYDNDGRLDLFVAAYRAPISELFKAARGEPRQALLPALYRNTGGATFQNVTASVGLDNPYMPMGAGFGDIDNDGWLDIYLGTGDPNFESLMPNVLLRNDAGVRFQDVTVAAGVGHLQKGHGVSFADIDNDGDQDIFHELGGMYPGDRFYNALFLNPANDGPKPHNHFITVKLVGTRSNRSAVGARLKIVAETPIGPREIHRAVGITSSFGWTPLRQEIGLGAATAINRIEIDWHTSGQRQIVDAPPMDRFITITEGQPGYDILHQADPQPVRHAGTTQ
jgi:hypothetical protein